MQHTKLVVTKREVSGKQGKKLRRAGILPANVYGKGIPSLAIEVSYVDFLPVYEEVGETGIIDLEVDGKTLPVLIKNPQFQYDSKDPIHVDFYQVNLKEKIRTSVPVKLIGEPAPVTDHQGLLMQMLNELEVEALPEAIPDFIEADTSTLAELGDILEVGDIKAPEGVTILTHLDENVAQVTALVVEEKEPQPVLNAMEGEATAPVEGEAPAQGAAEPATTPEEK